MIVEKRVTPSERVSALKECIDRKGVARILEAHNGLSGILAERARVQKDGQTLEFDGLWESSLTDSASKGMPDASIVGCDSRIHTIDEILNVTYKPIIVDGDTGGEPAQFEYLVQNLERLGVSAVIIEDKIYPKRNSLDANPVCAPVSEIFDCVGHDRITRKDKERAAARRLLTGKPNGGKTNGAVVASGTQH